jgi:magnesium-transporting ATPase (P-type)
VCALVDSRAPSLANAVAPREPGLSSDEARRRLREAGPNVLAAADSPHWTLRFLRNLTHLFALLLWAGAALAWVGGMPELSGAIVAVVLVNAVFSFVQEYRAEHAVDVLARFLPHLVRVRRDGRQAEIASEDVVPGDLVLLGPGDRVPADARVTCRVYGSVGLWVGLAGMLAFLTAYWLAGWRPFEPLADEGALYLQATAMTYAGIVAGQVGAAFAFRTSGRSVFSVGLLSNRFLLVGITVELALLVALLYMPPLNGVFHTAPVDPRGWLLLAAIPPVVLAAEELRKAVMRTRRRT